MFESVDLPAPFSPRSACTSPAATSKSTPSFATTPGKRLTIPRISTAGGGGAPAAPLRSSSSVVKPLLALRAADHALHEPVHRVEILDAELLALRHAQLPLLVVERPRELVELAADDRGALLRDRGLRLRGHLRPVRGERREAVLDAPVVEAGLPRAVHRGLRAAEVVRPPVVDRGGQPGLRRELLRVRVVADPRDAGRLGELAGGGRVDVLAEHVRARGVQALGRLLLLGGVEPRV